MCWLGAGMCERCIGMWLSGFREPGSMGACGESTEALSCGMGHLDAWLCEEVEDAEAEGEC